MYSLSTVKHASSCPRSAACCISIQPENTYLVYAPTDFAPAFRKRYGGIAQRPAQALLPVFAMHSSLVTQHFQYSLQHKATIVTVLLSTACRPDHAHTTCLACMPLYELKPTVCGQVQAVDVM